VLPSREYLAIHAGASRRTALVALCGELDIATVPRVAEVLDALDPDADGIRHVVLDLRDVTFIDVFGMRELLRHNDYARANRHNFAVVRGTAAVERLLEITGARDQLVLVDDPADLVPPLLEPWASQRSPSQ
jgi:stage II sporulation protein AA (anti-sigma F factor antagonist)